MSIMKAVISWLKLPEKVKEFDYNESLYKIDAVETFLWRLKVFKQRDLSIEEMYQFTKRINEKIKDHKTK